MLWIVKEDGAKWDGGYFRQLLREKVFPFLKNPRNVLSVADVTFLHDKAPCCKALTTQELLRESGLDFFSNNEWPSSSPDLNPAEHIGAILKEEVEKKLLASQDTSKDSLMATLQEVLEDLQGKTDLFRHLLQSYPSRIRAVLQAQGGPTDY